MVLGKLPVPGRLTNFDHSRARAYCACSRFGWVCLDIFISPAKQHRDICIASLASSSSAT